MAFPHTRVQGELAVDVSERSSLGSCGLFAVRDLCLCVADRFQNGIVSGLSGRKIRFDALHGGLIVDPGPRLAE